MQIDLTKGMSLDLSKVEGLTNISVGANWGMITESAGFLGFGATKTAVDLDLSATTYDENNTLLSTCYFARKDIAGISLDGDDLSGDEEDDDSDNETIIVDLTKVDSRVKSIVFCLVSFKGQPFGALPYAKLSLYDQSKKCLAGTNINITENDEYKNKVSMVFAKLEKVNDVWSYKAICEPTNFSSISALAPKAINFN